MVSTEELLRQIADLQEQVEERHAYMSRVRSRERDQRTARTASVQSDSTEEFTTDEVVANSVD
jgi:hypothetical protein